MFCPFYFSFNLCQSFAKFILSSDEAGAEEMQPVSKQLPKVRPDKGLTGAKVVVTE
jgi:hypothetical protein